MVEYVSDALLAALFPPGAGGPDMLRLAGPVSVDRAVEASGVEYAGMRYLAVTTAMRVARICMRVSTEQQDIKGTGKLREAPEGPATASPASTVSDNEDRRERQRQGLEFAKLAGKYAREKPTPRRTSASARYGAAGTALRLQQNLSDSVEAASRASGRRSAIATQHWLRSHTKIAALVEISGAVDTTLFETEIALEAPCRMARRGLSRPETWIQV